MQIHLTAKSSNAKTGPIPVWTTSSETCNPLCPHKDPRKNLCQERHNDYATK